jgi:hypothetical protein
MSAFKRLRCPDRTWKEQALAERREEDFAFPEPPEGLLKAPEDSVVALLDGPDQAEAAIEELAGEGFERDRIYVLCGPKGAERLDVSGRHHGLRGRIYRLIEWMGDEKDLLLRSRDHLAAGGLVMTVPADEERKAAAARILGSHGGHGMAHFGRGHWEPLGS